jgi:hypothetical protein
MMKVVACETAEAFLDEMSATRGQLWAKRRKLMAAPGDWIFRGVARADYPLRPSAFRENAFAPFAPGQKVLPIPTAAEQRAREDALLVKFCSEADHMGISVPSDRPELRDPRCAIPEYDPCEFPPISKQHMFALAQHYGIPTRLLDWTRKPMVAAYFAVEQVAKVRAKRDPDPKISGEEPCAVWALDQGFVRAMAKTVTRDPTIDPAIFVVTAPYATNPNLAAQGGLFTLVQPRSRDPHPIPDLDEALQHMADNAQIERGSLDPVLCKFTLPAKETRTALAMLAAEGMDAATVRPGLAGVAEALRERWSHQTALPGRRS